MINNKIDDDLFNLIVFNIGMIELISYYKCVCPKKVVIEAGYLDQEQQAWFKKLFYNGLGEFFYVNNIDVKEDELFDFVIKGEKIEHIVIGLPLYPSGDRCEMTPIVEAFKEKITPLFENIDIVFQDERDSTLEASEILHENNKNSKKQKNIIDSHAALVILERYLKKIGQL